MTPQQITEQSAAKLKDGFGKDQIRREIVTFAFTHYIGTLTIDAIINEAMEIYLEAYKKSQL